MLAAPKAEHGLISAGSAFMGRRGAPRARLLPRTPCKPASCVPLRQRSAPAACATRRLLYGKRLSPRSIA